MQNGKKKKHLWLYILIGIVIGIGVGVGYELFFSSTVSPEVIQQVFEKDSSYKYFYNQLTDHEKDIYQMIYYVSIKHEEEINIDETNIDVIKEVFSNVLYDHPELYYLDGAFEYQQYHKSIDFMPNYDYSITEVEEMDKKIEKKIAPFLSETQKLSSPIEKAKATYDYLVKSIEYQDESKDNQNIISSIVNGKSVCAGYARGYQYILNQLGIECVYITGTANESSRQTSSDDGHAWVMVHINDDYYYCDPTWADVIEDGSVHTCYGFFMMNSDEMLRNYKPEVKYEKTNNQKYNYFKENNCYMETYDENVLSHAIKLGLKNKNHVAEIKCANQTLYKQVKSKLESSYLGYRVLNRNGCWSERTTYSWDDQLYLIELYY